MTNRPQQIVDKWSRNEIDAHEACCLLREYFYPADGPRQRTVLLSGSRINGRTRGSFPAVRPATGA